MSEPQLARLEDIERVIQKTDRPLPFREAAEYLNCSKSYLYKLTHRRLIAFFKPLGKKVYFRRSDLDAFLLQRPVKTKAEIEQQAINHCALN